MSLPDDQANDLGVPPSPSAAVDRKRGTSVFDRLRLRGRSTNDKNSSLSEPLDFGISAHGQLLGLTISLRVPFTETGAGRNGTMKVLYVVRCTLSPPENAPVQTPPKSWEVRKKFSDFTKLDREIKDALMKSFSSAEGAYGLGLLPPRHLLTSDFDEQVILERKHGFVQYLQSALTASFFYQDIQPLLAMFLECPGAAKLGKGGGMMRLSIDDDLPTPPDKGTAILTETIHGEAQHGFLHKHQGPSAPIFKTYRLVFCVLNFGEGMFRYYRSSQPILLGEMKVKDVYGKVTVLEPKQFGVPASGYGFSVWTPTREMIFYAETYEDRNQWVQAFRTTLSNVVPIAAATPVISSPRPPQSPYNHPAIIVDPILPEISLGSLVFTQESRRLSEHRAYSDADHQSSQPKSRNSSFLDVVPETAIQMTTVAPISPRKSTGGGGARAESLSVEQMQKEDAVKQRAASKSRSSSFHGEAGADPPRASKSSRADSLLFSVPEKTETSPPIIPIPSMSHRREHSGSLQSHTREALQASASRRRTRTGSDSLAGGTVRSRTASDFSVPPPPPSPSPSLSIGLATGRPKSSSFAHQGEYDKSGVSSRNPSFEPLPRFPSNLSAMLDTNQSPQIRPSRGDSIRPPSTAYDPLNSPSPPKRSTLKDRVSLLRSGADPGSPFNSSWRSKLPPPRFPSNIRIASSGGASSVAGGGAESNGGGVSQAHRLLVRGISRHAPKQFRILHKMSGTSSRFEPSNSVDPDAQELFARALWKLRTDSLPTRNPHILTALLYTPNPWKGRAVHLMTAHQFSACMENVYYDTHSLRKSAAFRPKPNDLIVSSVARAGATPIILALDSLRSGRLVNVQDLPGRVPWIESKELDEAAAEASNAPLSPVDSARDICLLKTTMPVRHCLGIAGGQVITKKSPKVVVVLRDPLDLKLSWFRHCRRVYKKCSKKGIKFDTKFTLADFAQAPIPSCNPTFSAAMAPNETYECYMREVLHLYTTGKYAEHMHIVFYEELLADCENTIRKLARFYHNGADIADENLVRAIVDALQDSIDFPGTMNEQTNRLRVGSTGQGFKEFSRHDVELIDDDWDRIVRAHFPEFDQYSAMYERVLGTPYPHPRVRPFDEDLAKARKSSGLGSIALLQPGRSSLKELKVAKFVQKALTNLTSHPVNEPFRTGVGAEGRNGVGLNKKRIDPDDSDDDE